MKLAVVVVCCLLLAGTDGFRWNGGGSGPFVPSPHNPNPGPFSPIDPYSRREADPEVRHSNILPERPSLLLAGFSSSSLPPPPIQSVVFFSFFEKLFISSHHFIFGFIYD